MASLIGTVSGCARLCCLITASRSAGVPCHLPEAKIACLTSSPQPLISLLIKVGIPQNEWPVGTGLGIGFEAVGWKKTSYASGFRSANMYPPIQNPTGSVLRRVTS